MVGLPGDPVVEPLSKAARVGGGVLPPVAEFPFRGGGGLPGADGSSFPGAGGVPSGSAAGPPQGFVAAAVDRLGGGVGGGAVEGGVGLAPVEAFVLGRV